MTAPKPNIIDRLLDGRSTDPTRKRPSWAKPRLVVCHIQQGPNDLHDYWNNSNIDADCTVWNQRTGELDRLLPDDVSPWTNGDTYQPTLTNPIIADIFNNKIPLYGEVPNGTGIFNHYSLTIEHQGFDVPGITPPQAESTAQLAAYWCSLYGLDPMISIVGHRDIGKKSCPGALFPMDQIRARAKELLKPMATIPPAFQNGKIGRGMLGELNSRGLTPATEEIYIVPERVSILYCTDGTKLEAYRNIDPQVGTLLDTWTVKVFKPV